MYSKWMPAAFVAVVAAFAFAAPALADSQELDVRAWQNGLGTPAATEIDVYAQQSGAATAKITIYAPKGYTAVLNQAPGTQIGVAGSFYSEGGATPTELDGTVVADDPAKYAADPTAQACAAGTHAAVWTLALGTGADAQQVHLFVDPATGTDANVASYVMQACFLSPDVPAASGGAPAAAKLLGLFMILPKVFANPATTGAYAWRALVEPYVAGTSTPSPGGTVEVQSLVVLPQTLTLTAKPDRKHQRVTFSGRVMAAGVARPGVSVHILAAPKLNSQAKTFAVVKTKKNGTFSVTKAITKTLYFQAQTNDFFVGDCMEAPIGTASCVLESLAPPPYSTIVKVVVPKKK
jgi:hypothetical protein